MSITVIPIFCAPSSLTFHISLFLGLSDVVLHSPPSKNIFQSLNKHWVKSVMPERISCISGVEALCTACIVRGIYFNYSHLPNKLMMSLGIQIEIHPMKMSKVEESKGFLLGEYESQALLNQCIQLFIVSLQIPSTVDSPYLDTVGTRGKYGQFSEY